MEGKENKENKEVPKLSECLNKQDIKYIVDLLNEIPKSSLLSESIKPYFEKIAKIYNVEYKDLEKIYLDSINYENLLNDKPIFDNKKFLEQLQLCIKTKFEFYNNFPIPSYDGNSYDEIFRVEKLKDKIVITSNELCDLYKNDIITFWFIKSLAHSSDKISIFDILKEDIGFYTYKKKYFYYFKDNEKVIEPLEDDESENFLLDFFLIKQIILQIYFSIIKPINSARSAGFFLILNSIYDYLYLIFLDFPTSATIDYIRNYIVENIFCYIDHIEDKQLKSYYLHLLSYDPEVYTYYQLEKTKRETLREIENKTDILNQSITEQKELSEKIKKEQKELNKQMQKSKNDIFSIMALFLTAFSVSIGFIGFASKSKKLDFDTIVTIGFFIVTFIAIIWAIVKEIILHDNSTTKYWDILKFLGTIFVIYLVSVFILNFLIDGEKFFSLLKYYLYSKYLH